MTNNRRTAILKLLRERHEPVTGNDLAEQFGVSRQVIVQDIALLRAQGADIVATPRGYYYGEQSTPAVFSRRVACRHTPEQSKLELTAMVESGCRVVDAIVEHPLYGEIRGLLMLNTIADVNDFIKRYQNQQAQLLSCLTDGVHLHTLETDHLGTIEAAKERLRQLDMLVLS
ncbi:MAG: transcription repressor NadR [bacterium]|jgi:transcriptional regulator of NAD metabolism